MPDVFVAPEGERPSFAEAKEGKREVKGKRKSEERAPLVKSGIKSTPRFKNPLSAYLYKPDGVNFETKRKNEEVVLFLRRHLITNVPWIMIAVLMLLAPIVLFSFPILDFLPPKFQFVSVLAWYLITAAFVLENFLIWFFNVGIVTNKRLVDIDFNSLLYKEVSDTELSQIQDVTYNMTGAIRAIFNYGDVFVQTASEKPNIEFLAIPRPDEVVKTLQKLRENKI